MYIHIYIHVYIHMYTYIPTSPFTCSLSDIVMERTHRKENTLCRETLCREHIMQRIPYVREHFMKGNVTARPQHVRYGKITLLKEPIM